MCHSRVCWYHGYFSPKYGVTVLESACDEDGFRESGSKRTFVPLLKSGQTVLFLLHRDLTLPLLLQERPSGSSRAPLSFSSPTAMTGPDPTTHLVA